jgi:hypothetical protein
MHFLLGNVFRENKNKLTVSHFIKVMEMQIIQHLELLILSAMQSSVPTLSCLADSNLNLYLQKWFQRKLW